MVEYNYAMSFGTIKAPEPDKEKPPQQKSPRFYSGRYTLDNHPIFLEAKPVGGGFAVVSMADEGERARKGTIVSKVFPSLEEAVKKLQQLAETEHLSTADALLQHEDAPDLRFGPGFDRL